MKKAENNDYQEAKAAVNKAQRAYHRALNAYLPLYRRRCQESGFHGEPTSAEMEAERASNAAADVLRSAKDHLQFLLNSTSPPNHKRERRDRWTNSSDVEDE